MSGNNDSIDSRGRSNTCFTPQSFSSSDKKITSKVKNIKHRKSFTLKKCHSDDNLFLSNKKTIYFIDVITQAINNSKAKQLTLSAIYDWIEKHKLTENKENEYYFDNNWKNLILKTLSSCPRFSCTPNKNFKTSLWTVNSNLKLESVARKRRATSMEKEEYEDNPGPAKRRAEMLELETSEIFEDITERISTSTTLNDDSDEFNSIELHPYVEKRSITYYKQNNKLPTDNLKIERMSDIIIQMQKEHSRVKQNIKNIHSCSNLIDMEHIPSTAFRNIPLPCIIKFQEINTNNGYSLEYCFRTEKYGLLPTSHYKLVSNIGHQVKSINRKGNVSTLLKSEKYDYHYKVLKENGCNNLLLQSPPMSSKHLCDFYAVRSLNTAKSLNKRNDALSMNVDLCNDNNDEIMKVDQRVNAESNARTENNVNVDDDI